MGNFKVPPEQLRWTPARETFPEVSSRDMPGTAGIVGQLTARQALTFSIQNRSHNHNAYVRGPDGSGRRTLIASLLKELNPEAERALDFCYVHNFANPDRPRLIILPGGQGRQFQQAMTRISLFIRDRLPLILKNDPIRSRREARREAAEREIRLKIAPLEKKLRADGLALIRTQSGPTSRVSIYPLVMGKPVSPEEYRNLVTQKQVREEDRLKAMKQVDNWQAEVNRFAHEVNQIWQQALQHIDQINASETARLVGEMTSEVGRKFKAPGMDVFLCEIIDDIVEKRVGRDTSHLADPTLLYGVNVLTTRHSSDKAPVIFASQPSVASLFGTIDPAWMSSGRAVTSFRGIRTGALLEADGGYLVLDAADVRAEPGSWRMLMRALRTGLAEVVPPELGWPYSAQSLKPEPIPVRVRVILTGSAALFETLNKEDADFVRLFKVIADFDDTMPRDKHGLHDYSRFLASLVAKENLLPFERSGMMALAQIGARLSSEPGRLTSRFGELADLAREACWLAGEDGADEVEKTHVEAAFRQWRNRSRLPLAQTIRRIDSGLIDLRVRGRSERQVNTCAPIKSGTLTLAQPAALTCVLGPAPRCRIVKAGDQQAHDESLEALLGHSLLLREAPRLLARLTSTASNNGHAPGGTGLAEACLLFSCLAQTPVRQELALTGDLDGQGRVRPVCSINERIEAWFELCNKGGLSGQQGVIIPRANLDALVLDHALVKACVNDMFQVVAVDHFYQALEIITGLRIGSWRDQAFPPDSMLGRARSRVLALSGHTDETSPGSSPAG